MDIIFVYSAIFLKKNEKFFWGNGKILFIIIYCSSRIWIRKKLVNLFFKLAYFMEKATVLINGSSTPNMKRDSEFSCIEITRILSVKSESKIEIWSGWWRSWRVNPSLSLDFRVRERLWSFYLEIRKLWHAYFLCWGIGSWTKLGPNIAGVFLI